MSRLPSPSAYPTMASRAGCSSVASGIAAVSPRSSSCCRSSAPNASSTYTWARDSNALLTSNDGFSVVAPMKVTSPRSTKGRNASCCALLKRCTSSTNRIVWRPDCASVASARATASRMSLTPASTAERAMKSALNAAAISRARVVLPEPGGPQRIIECSLPDANATASGLPTASRWRCPTTASIVVGRNRSASGVAGLATTKRSVADDIGALRRREREQLRRELGIALQPGERDARVLAEVVRDVQCGESGRVEAQADVAERGLLVLGRGAQPVEAVRRRKVAPLEGLLDVIATGEQRRRSRAQRLIVAALDHLVQVRVVDPHPLAVADQQLLIGLVDTPAKFAGAGDGKLAARLLYHAAVLVRDRLHETRARGLGVAHERAQTLQGGTVRAGRNRAQYEQKQRSAQALILAHRHQYFAVAVGLH